MYHFGDTWVIHVLTSQHPVHPAADDNFVIKTGLPLIGNIFNPLAKSALMLLWLTPAAPAVDASIQKKIYGLGRKC